MSVTTRRCFLGAMASGFAGLGVGSVGTLAVQKSLTAKTHQFLRVRVSARVVGADFTGNNAFLKIEKLITAFDRISREDVPVDNIESITGRIFQLSGGNAKTLLEMPTAKGGRKIVQMWLDLKPERNGIAEIRFAAYAM